MRPGERQFFRPVPEARVAAQKAALGDVKQGYDWDLAGAETEFKRALQLNPSHLLTRMWYAECLRRMGRYDDAIAETGRAVAQDPVSPASYSNRGMVFFRARRYDEAIRASQESLDLDPNRVTRSWWLCLWARREPHEGGRHFG